MVKTLFGLSIPYDDDMNETVVFESHDEKIRTLLGIASLNTIYIVDIEAVDTSHSTVERVSVQAVR